MTEKRQKAAKVKCKHDESLEQNSQYLWNIVFSRRSIWVLLALIRRCRQHFTKIDQEKRKVDVNIDYVISMEFLSLSRWRSSSQATQKGVGKDRLE